MWYIIRHGETSHNKNKIVQGHHPSVLNITGIEQSKAIAKKLLEIEENLNDFKFITSPLLRTRQTIQIIMHILGIEKEALEDHLLVSKNKGIFENLPRTFIEENFPEEIENKIKDRWNYTPPKGESCEILHSRIQEFYNKYKDEEKLVIVLHGSGSPILRGFLENKNKEEIKTLKNHSQNHFYQWNGKIINKLKID